MRDLDVPHTGNHEQHESCGRNHPSDITRLGVSNCQQPRTTKEWHVNMAKGKDKTSLSPRGRKRKEEALHAYFVEDIQILVEGISSRRNGAIVRHLHGVIEAIEVDAVDYQTHGFERAGGGLVEIYRYAKLRKDR